jgi:hypothetical protein
MRFPVTVPNVGHGLRPRELPTDLKGIPMHLARFTLLALALTVLATAPTMAGNELPGPVAPVAQYSPNYFAVTTIVNDSPYVVTYQYGWGDGDYQYSMTLKPGESWDHWWTYDYANQDSSPWFYIRIDGDAGDYPLRSFNEPDTDHGGKVYMIRFDAQTQKFKLFAKLYTD